MTKKFLIFLFLIILFLNSFSQIIKTIYPEAAAIKTPSIYPQTDSLNTIGTPFSKFRFIYGKEGLFNNIFVDSLFTNKIKSNNLFIEDSLGNLISISPSTGITLNIISFISPTIYSFLKNGEFAHYYNNNSDYYSKFTPFNLSFKDSTTQKLFFDLNKDSIFYNSPNGNNYFKLNNKNFYVYVDSSINNSYLNISNKNIKLFNTSLLTFESPLIELLGNEVKFSNLLSGEKTNFKELLVITKTGNISKGDAYLIFDSSRVFTLAQQKFLMIPKESISIDLNNHNFYSESLNYYFKVGNVTLNKGNLNLNSGDIEISDGNIYNSNGNIELYNGFIFNYNLGVNRLGALGYEGLWVGQANDSTPLIYLGAGPYTDFGIPTLKIYDTLNTESVLVKLKKGYLIIRDSIPVKDSLYYNNGLLKTREIRVDSIKTTKLVVDSITFPELSNYVKYDTLRKYWGPYYKTYTISRQGAMFTTLQEAINYANSINDSTPCFVMYTGTDEESIIIDSNVCFKSVNIQGINAYNLSEIFPGTNFYIHKESLEFYIANIGHFSLYTDKYIMFYGTNIYVDTLKSISLYTTPILTEMVIGEMRKLQAYLDYYSILCNVTMAEIPVETVNKYIEGKILMASIGHLNNHYIHYDNPSGPIYTYINRDTLGTYNFKVNSFSGKIGELNIGFGFLNFNALDSINFISNKIKYLGKLYITQTGPFIDTTYIDADSIKTTKGIFDNIKTDYIESSRIVSDTINSTKIKTNNLIINNGDPITKIVKIGSHCAIILNDIDTFWLVKDTL